MSLHPRLIVLEDHPLVLGATVEFLVTHIDDSQVVYAGASVELARQVIGTTGADCIVRAPRLPALREPPAAASARTGARAKAAAARMARNFVGRRIMSWTSLIGVSGGGVIVVIPSGKINIPRNRGIAPGCRRGCK